MFRLNLFHKKSPEEKKEMDMLGQGFYLEYNEVPNGLGGYHPVNIALKNIKDADFSCPITDRYGKFLNFPGTMPGNWESKLEGPLNPAVQFTFSATRFIDGVCRVTWLVQPDGRYFEDEDGFGAEHCSEIYLYSKMNTKGQFLCPFSEDEPDCPPVR